VTTYLVATGRALYNAPTDHPTHSSPLLEPRDGSGSPAWLGGGAFANRQPGRSAPYPTPESELHAFRKAPGSGLSDFSDRRIRSRFNSTRMCFLAEACGTAGRLEEGLAALAEAIAIVEKNGRALQRGGTAPIEGGPNPPTFRRRSAVWRPDRSRRMLPESHRDCATTRNQGFRAKGGYKLEPIVATTGQEDRSTADVGADLWLVQRRLRHRRPEGR
jgi:hypothetical protein